MSFTFKSLVLFIKIVTKLLLLRPFGIHIVKTKKKKVHVKLFTFLNIAYFKENLIFSVRIKHNCCMCPQ